MTQQPEEAHIRKAWNRKLSSLRIFIEHAFGRLKGRFPHLRFLSGYDLNEIYRSIEALMVIHNILEGWGDDPMLIAGFNGKEVNNVELVQGEAPERMDQNLGDDDLYRTGLLRRKQLVALSLQEQEDNNSE